LSSARLKKVEKRRTYQKKQTYWKEKGKKSNEKK
jgi:hypothetical protein